MNNEYALVENGIVLEVVVCDAAFAASQPGTWVLTPYNSETGEGKVGKGFTFDGVNFAPPQGE